jgi:hypothetical protein
MNRPETKAQLRPMGHRPGVVSIERPRSAVPAKRLSNTDKEGRELPVRSPTPLARSYGVAGSRGTAPRRRAGQKLSNAKTGSWETAAVVACETHLWPCAIPTFVQWVGAARDRCCAAPYPGPARPLALSFWVSSDEETVRVEAQQGSLRVDLGEKTAHYLLLTLARQRLADAEAGIADSECGWLYVADLTHDESMAPARVNLDVCRLRQRLAARGIDRAASIVQRRRGSGCIRIGTADLVIHAG